LLEQYVAVSDYTKREESDINLKAGNVVEVIEKNEHGKLVMKVRPPRFRTDRSGFEPDSLLIIKTFF